MRGRDTSWVVYLRTLQKNADGRMAVCEQDEWDAMELAKPGYHTLVRAGIGTEAEAELLARGTSGDPVPRTPRERGRVKGLGLQQLGEPATLAAASGTAGRPRPASPSGRTRSGVWAGW